MIDPIQSLPLMGSGMEPATGAARSPVVPGGTGFGDMLSQSFSALNDQMTGAEHLSEMAATGALPDPTVALVEVEKADLAFQMAVQVRNRMVESWQEMTRIGF